MHSAVASHLPDISALCEKHGVAHLELFGSATGADFNPDASDFDFLVGLDTKIPGSRAKRWTELADALEQLLGRHVDLVNPRYIRNPYFLEAVKSSRTVIYDRQNTHLNRRRFNRSETIATYAFPTRATGRFPIYFEP